MEEAHKQLIKSFFKPISFDVGNEVSFFEMWEEKNFKQNELITEAGSLEKHFYIVVSGVQAIYLLNQKGEKVVLGFSYAGSPSGVFDSFIYQKPADTFLEALKPSKLLALSLKNYQSLFNQQVDFYKWGYQFFQDILFGRLFREVELLTLSAEERYIAFMRRCPDELKVIPQKYLASYLNMKPETFSRLRASVQY